MRVVASIHFAVPYRMAGSETMLHAMLAALVKRGHDVIGVVSDMPEAPAEWTLDGVRYMSRNGKRTTGLHVESLRADVLVSHHQNADQTILSGKRLGVPTVFIQHSDHPMVKTSLALRPDLVVFNTDWMARDWAHKAVNWMRVRPPIDAAQHRTTPGDCVTLVNLNRNKGVEVFKKVAQHLSDIPFLGVTGAHDTQITWGMPDNVTIIPQTSDMRRDVWSRTRLLLVPSIYESYGMVSVEACASGIPVIAHPTPGLREALGKAGIFADRDNTAQWIVEVRRLMTSPADWAAASDACRRRSADLDPTRELAEWAGAIEALHTAHQARNGTLAVT